MEIDPLYRAYSLRVYRYFRCHLPDAQDAEDLTQAVFERAQRNAAQYDPLKGAPEPWLFRIARNALRDHLRRAAIRRFLPLPEAEALADSAPSPETQVLMSEQFVALRDALEMLRPRERQVVALRYFGELRNVDIAKVLGLSEKNVGVILSRTLRKLRQILEEASS